MHGNFLMKKLIASLLGAACFATPAAAGLMGMDAEEEHGIEEGRYAPLVNGAYRNSGAFFCSSEPDNDCYRKLKGMKLTSGEKALASPTPLAGDLVVSRDGSGRVTVSGVMAVFGECVISTGFPQERQAAYDQFVPAAAACEDAEHGNGAVKCPFVFTYLPELGDAPVTLTVEPADGSGDQNRARLALSVSLAQEVRDVSPECVSVIEKTGFAFQTEEENRKARLAGAKLAFLSADATLNAEWSRLDKFQKNVLLPSQRQWIRDKDKKCGAVNMKGDEAALEKMYRCQTEMTERRIPALYEGS